MMNFTNNAVSTPYCQGPTIQTWTAFHQNTQPEHWLQLFIITSGKECAQNSMPHRLKLPICFKSREKCFLHPSRDVNMTLVLCSADNSVILFPMVNLLKEMKRLISIKIYFQFKIHCIHTDFVTHTQLIVITSPLSSYDYSTVWILSVQSNKYVPVS